MTLMGNLSEALILKEWMESKVIPKTKEFWAPKLRELTRNKNLLIFKHNQMLRSLRIRWIIQIMHNNNQYKQVNI
jgi:hypothetical protein